jgi:hypothetical protein
VKNSRTKRQRNITAVVSLIGTVLVMGTLNGWFDQSQSENSSWYDEDKHLPDKELLQERINKSLSDIDADVDRSIGADVERIIDPEAMEAKLAGLTKTVTLSREPSPRELGAYFQSHRENYREASKFAFTQLIFSFTEYGGLAITKAREAKTIIETQASGLSSLKETPQEAYLSSLQLDERYGQGFGDKLVKLIIDSQSGNLPCWSDAITSKVGAHILCFKQASLGIIPALETVRSQVINDWRYWVSEQQP